jgi:hypothetical protein
VQYCAYHSDAILEQFEPEVYTLQLGRLSVAALGNFASLKYSRLYIIFLRGGQLVLTSILNGLCCD